jgi:hypothetical protein
VPNPPSSSWKEVVPADEGPRLERHARALRDLQVARAADGRPARALHAKGFGVTGDLEILGDLPEHLRQGLFAAPAKHRCYVRYSNGAGKKQADGAGDVRGVAIKVLGVSGKKIIPGLESATTQDLLFIRTPSIPFRDPDEFVGFVLAMRSPALALPRMICALGLLRFLGLVGPLSRSVGAPFTSVATADYHTALPVRFGPFAAKLSLLPRAENGAAPAVAESHPHALSRDLAQRLTKAPVAYDLTVQLFRDEASTPIEDPTVTWSEDDAPREKVGVLTLPVQDADSERGKGIAARIDGLSFDPWHALEAHRPLGAIMRARNVAYRLSTEARHASAEPEGSEIA